MNKLFIGIDNGTTGTVAFIYDEGPSFFIETPIKIEQSYTKTKQIISRIDYIPFYEYLLTRSAGCQVIHALIERPGINPTRWKTSMSAMRALEATLIAVECLNFPHSYIDSKEWQKALLPAGLEKEELKKASVDIGCRLFPQHKELIIKHKDADGLLIAEYCRRKFG